MIKAIIIDDEQDCRDALINILERYCSGISVAGQAANVRDGLSIIKTQEPDVVFLDIQMPDGTGFDLLEKLEKVEFQVIFVTAYDHYALTAFKFSALDYILKPVDPQQLIRAVEKIRLAPAGLDELKQKLNILLRNKNGFERITLPTLEGLSFVDVKDIIRCEAEGNYTWFYIDTGKKILITRTLKDYEDLLTPFGFFRVHHSHLVSIKYVDRYVKGGGGLVIMADGAKVDVSRRRKDEFLKQMASQ